MNHLHLPCLPIFKQSTYHNCILNAFNPTHRSSIAFITHPLRYLTTSLLLVNQKILIALDTRIGQFFAPDHDVDPPPHRLHRRHRLAGDTRHLSECVSTVKNEWKGDVTFFLAAFPTSTIFSALVLGTSDGGGGCAAY